MIQDEPVMAFCPHQKSIQSDEMLSLLKTRRQQRIEGSRRHMRAKTIKAAQKEKHRSLQSEKAHTKKTKRAKGLPQAYKLLPDDCA